MTSVSTPRNVIRLGTRRSLLAWAQSGWVAREIERLNPGLKVEMVGIDTRGDKILDVSLRNVEGKEFFVAELDAALRTGQVDMTVHSMKDLSLERPAEFILAAIPRRANCRDVILFGPDVQAKLEKGEPIRIGTSSPRRIENIPAFLEKALPSFGGTQARTQPKLEFVEIRGNVNTRLSRVREPVGSERHLDGVVLAFAGLIRLWADVPGRAELQKLFEGLRWMVLPIRENPTAPAQGALAIECRKDDDFVRAALGKLHDTQTADHVARERQVLAEWGGGCHQKFGATSLSLPGGGPMLFIRGRKPDETFVDELKWRAPGMALGKASGGVRAWDGKQWRAGSAGEERIVEAKKSEIGKAVFVAHSRAVISDSGRREEAAELIQRLQKARVWTSGTQSWFKLAEQGIWVEGCAESLGFDFVAPMIQEEVLGLPSLQGEGWTVLTHEKASEGWSDFSGIRILATYRLIESPDQNSNQAALALKDATHIFWSSGSQFDAMKNQLSQISKGAHHACGPGKTAAYLKSQGLNPEVFPSLEEWKKWLR